jgi:outer membrane protein assembly factor BamE (lipoprotein component of BamABCDE complex)
MTRLLPPMAARLAAGVMTLALGACAATVAQRGNLPPPNVLSEIKPGTTDKETVTRLLGSPSSVSTFDNNTWYYISQKTEELAFFKPEVTDQEVVTVSFGNDGVVSEVQTTGMDSRRQVEPVARTTPAPGKELSFIEQLLGNFGRFNTNSVGGSKPPGQSGP